MCSAQLMVALAHQSLLANHPSGKCTPKVYTALHFAWITQLVVNAHRKHEKCEEHTRVHALEFSVSV